MASQHETVVEAIVAQLEAITAGSNGYAFSPAAVQRVLWFPVEWEPDPTFDTLYVVHPGDETMALGPDSCSIEGRAEIVIVVFRRLDATSSTASSGGPEQAWQIVNDLVADVAQAVFGGPTFGGAAVGLVDQSIFIDRTPSAELQSYAMAALRFVVRYQTDRPGR